MTTPQSPIARTIATYFDAWNETTLEGCKKKLDQACAPNVAYRDPVHTCSGTTELATRILRSRDNAPDYRVEVSTTVDGYDRTFRYGWLFVFGGGVHRLPGIDVVEVDAEGRIQTLVSFFGPVVPRAEGEALREGPRWTLASAVPTL